MGNFLRRSCAVHPASGDGGRHVEAGERKGRLRIKVRIRRDKLEELLNVARSGRDQSDGGGKIGFLILKECLEGGLPVSVLCSGDDVWSQRCGNHLENRRLDTIRE